MCACVQTCLCRVATVRSHRVGAAQTQDAKPQPEREWMHGARRSFPERAARTLHPMRAFAKPENEQWQTSPAGPASPRE